MPEDSGINSGERSAIYDSFTSRKEDYPYAWVTNPIDEKPIKRQSELPFPDSGILRTPLTKAITHLLKIGSTDRAELEVMAKQFITPRGVREKFEIDIVASKFVIEICSKNVKHAHIKKELFDVLKSQYPNMISDGGLGFQSKIFNVPFSIAGWINTDYQFDE